MKKDKIKDIYEDLLRDSGDKKYPLYGDDIPKDIPEKDLCMIYDHKRQKEVRMYHPLVKPISEKEKQKLLKEWKKEDDEIKHLLSSKHPPYL